MDVKNRRTMKLAIETVASLRRLYLNHALQPLALSDRVEATFMGGPKIESIQISLQTSRIRLRHRSYTPQERLKLLCVLPKARGGFRGTIKNRVKSKFAIVASNLVVKVLACIGIILSTTLWPVIDWKRLSPAFQKSSFREFRLWPSQSPNGPMIAKTGLRCSLALLLP